MALKEVTLQLGKEQRHTGSKAQPYRPQEGHVPEQGPQGAQRLKGKSSRIYSEGKEGSLSWSRSTLHTHPHPRVCWSESLRPSLKAEAPGSQRAKIEVALDLHPCIPFHAGKPCAEGAGCNQPRALPWGRKLGMWAGEDLCSVSTPALPVLLALGNTGSVNMNNKGHAFIFPFF